MLNFNVSTKIIEHHVILLCTLKYLLMIINFLSLQDTPGFVVNRLLVPYIMEAVRMLERGMN